MAPNDERRVFADGEVVWSWRAHAGVKFRIEMMQNDGGNRWFTGEIAYKP